MLSEHTRVMLLHTLAGRAFLAAAAVKLALAAIGFAVPLPDAFALVDALATLVILFVLGYAIVRLAHAARSRLLWRVRRKLVLSYIFIGVVPALLIGVFFLVGGYMLAMNLSSYLFKAGFDDVLENVRLMAGTSSVELSRVTDLLRTAPGIVERRRANLQVRYPEMSLAIVPTVDLRGATTPASIVAGPWRHLDPPATIPNWVIKSGGFHGPLAMVHPDAPDEPQLVLRAVELIERAGAGYAVVVDLPFDGQVIEDLHDRTGIRAGDISLRSSRARPLLGRLRRAARALVQPESKQAPPSTADAAPRPDATGRLGNVAYLDYRDWQTGEIGRAYVSIDVRLGELYARLSSAQPSVNGMRLGDAILLVLGTIAALFVVIQLVALTMGVALARSITGAVHELFAGTERVRHGDFTHRIRVTTNDQLGELAHSFNQMTESIEHLLQTEAEKKRLEEELRIAREIQMSLLPRGPLAMPGLEVTALCVPAREVGGDYYDFFPLGDRRVAILVADVSGKGTSAALYMAELKGLLLALSQRHESPRDLLIEVNRILSDHLDSRSFITMTYGVIDLSAGVMTYCRAGHTPMIYLPARGPRRGLAQALQPGGMVLGLRIDGNEERFSALLEEETMPLDRGDVFVLYTDGVTEAMNSDSELFGEGRLRRIIEEHGHLRSAELRERILREIEAFVGEADQHDDLTLILIKVADVGAVVSGVATEVMAS
ncbi:MAG TPA: SpoIIE family protein phosphatase [Vicinamibacterales bacterium]|nr:SpoIIE family protein phosphatase [Vicinamibacterales bacterium]